MPPREMPLESSGRDAARIRSRWRARPGCRRGTGGCRMAEEPRESLRRSRPRLRLQSSLQCAASWRPCGPARPPPPPRSCAPSAPRRKRAADKTPEPPLRRLLSRAGAEAQKAPSPLSKWSAGSSALWPPVGRPTAAALWGAPDSGACEGDRARMGKAAGKRRQRGGKIGRKRVRRRQKRGKKRKRKMRRQRGRKKKDNGRRKTRKKRRAMKREGTRKKRQRTRRRPTRRRRWMKTLSSRACRGQENRCPCG